MIFLQEHHCGVNTAIILIIVFFFKLIRQQCISYNTRRKSAEIYQQVLFVQDVKANTVREAVNIFNFKESMKESVMLLNKILKINLLSLQSSQN